MMGPASHRKATALGDVPGQARRLQSAGKILRDVFGNRDPIMFGAKSLLQVTAPFDVREFLLDPKNSIRDFKDDKGFLCRARTATQSIRRVI